jgi:two-component system, NarL family, nitrate/nitrite response regulator NarL
VIIEEQQVVREGLRRLLEAQEGFAVVGLCGNAREALGLLVKNPCDLILLGMRSVEDPVATLKSLLVAQPGACVLLTGETDVPFPDLLLSGARGLLPATATPTELYEAIRTVMAGQYWLDGEALEHLVQHLRDGSRKRWVGARDADGLSQRERQVAAGVSRGESNREIADRLGLSEGTVKDYLTGIYARLGLANRAGLSAWATRRGLGDEPAPGGDDAE